MFLWQISTGHIYNHTYICTYITGMQALGNALNDPVSHHWASVCTPVVGAIRNGCGLDTAQASHYHARCSFATRGTISTFENLTVHVHQVWTIWPSKECLHVKMTLEVMNGQHDQRKIPLFYFIIYASWSHSSVCHTKIKKGVVV